MSIAKHTTYNVVGSAVPLIVSLATVPIYLEVIGIERYGALSLAWLVLGYFGLFDLGLTRATAQRVAVLKYAEAQDRSDVFWTAAAVNIGMGIVGGLALYVGSSVFFLHYFQVDEAIRSEIGRAIPLLAAAVPVATLSGVATGALQGRERFIEFNAIAILTACMVQVAPLAVALWFGPNLQGLILAALVARIVALLVSLWLVWNKMLRSIVPRFDRRQWVALLSFGGWVTISSVVGPAMVIMDRFIIGSVLGAAAVAIYTIPFQLAQRFAIFPNAVSDTLFPRLSSESDVGPARALSSLATRAVALICLVPVVGGICAMRPFLSFWLGNNFDDQSVAIGQVALAGWWIIGVAYAPFTLIQARGNARYTALLHLSELLPYLALLALMGHYFGLVGVAATFAVRCAAAMIILDLKAHDRQNSVLAELVVPSLFIVLGIIVMEPLPTGPALGAWGLALTAASAVYAWWRLPLVVKNRVLRIAR